MKRTVFDCDQCGKPADPVITVGVCTGWVEDAAGGPSERRVYTVDFCPKCAASKLREFIDKLDEDEGKKLLASLKYRDPQCLR